ncbi:MAG TPA: hypothetical protein VFW66_00930 [Gemmatimonadales bacterium]|nr:hypothetical protein [Gemmatimonadales bacterium]
MRFMIAGMAAATFAVVACSGGRERTQTATAKDTIVTQQRTQDTAVVTRQRQTTVNVDTNKTGSGVVGKDTVQH